MQKVPERLDSNQMCSDSDFEASPDLFEELELVRQPALDCPSRLQQGSALELAWALDLSLIHI